MLKIAHIITTLDTGGAETALLRLVSKMDKSRFENSVFSILGEGKLAGAVRETGTRVYCAGLNTRFPNPLLLYKLIQQIRDYRPDIIQTWLYHADFVGSLAGKLGVNAPVIWNLRCSELGPEDSSWSLRRLIALLARWSSSSPTAVIVNSISGKASHEAIGYRPARWEVIPNGFDMARYPHDETARMSARKILGVDGSVPLVGIVGRHAPIKEHEVFLEGASILLKTFPDCRFALVGKGLDTG
ncbi:MAG: glycosyltransferase, partial [Nitrospinae bacterium]|nr:glycosyltransferase [Nitrospinota bacterium]